MTFNVWVQIEDAVQEQVDSAALREAAVETLTYLKVDPDSDLTIVVADDERLHELNRTYRDVDAPTDVLSFPDGSLDPETGHRYLGDVLISLPRAQAQADRAGHPTDSELQLLVIHGVLHLLGHDHLAQDEKERMWRAQREILDSLGVTLRRQP